MRRAPILACVLALIGAGAAFAQPATAPATRPSAPATAPAATPTPAPALTPQQERMRACNAEAATKSLAGEPRQAFMSSCLSGASAAAAPTTFKTEAEAKRACAKDAVVWANTESQIFHAAGSQFYGKTADGSYMCQSVAQKGGFRAAGNARN